MRLGKSWTYRDNIRTIIHGVGWRMIPEVEGESTSLRITV